MLKTSLAVATIIFSMGASAAPSISHNNPSGSDRVRTKDGASCEQAVATGKSFTAGVYGDSGYNDGYYDPYQRRMNNGDKGVYAGVTIQFGGAERIDCTRMYDNEMSRKDIELEMLETKHQQELVLLQQEIDRLKHRGSLNFTE